MPGLFGAGGRRDCNSTAPRSTTRSARATTATPSRTIDASEERIRRDFRKLAGTHPDLRGPDPGPQSQFPGPAGHVRPGAIRLERIRPAAPGPLPDGLEGLRVGRGTDPLRGRPGPGRAGPAAAVAALRPAGATRRPSSCRTACPPETPPAASSPGERRPAATGSRRTAPSPASPRSPSPPSDRTTDIAARVNFFDTTPILQPRRHAPRPPWRDSQARRPNSAHDLHICPYWATKGRRSDFYACCWSSAAGGSRWPRVKAGDRVGAGRRAENRSAPSASSDPSFRAIPIWPSSPSLQPWAMASCSSDDALRRPGHRAGRGRPVPVQAGAAPRGHMRPARKSMFSKPPTSARARRCTWWRSAASGCSSPARATASRCCPP